jgi:hypothetical protein
VDTPAELEANAVSVDDAGDLLVLDGADDGESKHSSVSAAVKNNDMRAVTMGASKSDSPKELRDGLDNIKLKMFGQKSTKKKRQFSPLLESSEGSGSSVSSASASAEAKGGPSMGAVPEADKKRPSTCEPSEQSRKKRKPPATPADRAGNKKVKKKKEKVTMDNRQGKGHGSHNPWGVRNPINITWSSPRKRTRRPGKTSPSKSYSK